MKLDFIYTLFGGASVSSMVPIDSMTGMFVWDAANVMTLVQGILEVVVCMDKACVVVLGCICVLAFSSMFPLWCHL